MVDGKLIQLRTIISILTMRTSEGRVEWTWDENLGIATATLVNGRVIVSKDPDLDTVITIQDADANTLAEINVGYTQNRDFVTEADQMYDVARRSALQIDSKLESIIREISD